MYTFADTIRIYPSKLVICREEVTGRKFPKTSAASLKNLKISRTDDSISKSTTKKIEAILATWIKSINYHNQYCRSSQAKSRHYPIFLTLTLSSTQIHTDQEIKRAVLMPFLQDLKRKFGYTYYFWRAEKQKNGNIHFHLVIDVYVDKKVICSTWNNHQNTLGYIDRFEDKFNHRSPPSTKIEGIMNLDKMGKYIAKYVSKKELEKNVEGKLWSCSRELKNLRVFSYILDNETNAYLEKLLDEGKVSFWSNEYCVILDFTSKFDFKHDYAYFNRLERNFHLEVYKRLYDPPKAQIRHTPVSDKANVPSVVQGTLFV